MLTSNAVCTAGDCADATLPTDGTAGSAWAFGSAKIDNISNHLMSNTPMGSTDPLRDYPTTGTRPWRGPYVDQVPANDPWQRSFIVTVRNLNPGVAAAAMKWTIVASAGPDGVLQTNPDALMTSYPVPIGDDIVARVR
jgi:hypothetical protein